MDIHVKSLPARAVLRDIAAALGGGSKPLIRENKIADNCSELFLSIPPRDGEGSIAATTFPAGFSLYQYDCCFNRDVMINFNISKIQPLKFIFCKEGRIDHSFANGSDKMYASRYQNIIIAGDKDHGHNIYFEAGKRVQLTSLEIDRTKFKRFHAYCAESLTPSLLRVLNDTSSQKEFYYQGNYSLATADVIKDLLYTEYLGFLRFLFLNGTLNLLLALQIEQFIDDERGDGGGGRLLRRRDLANVETAIGIVTDDMQTRFSVAYLAREVGTNVNKLQEGFKYAYDMTVNRYIMQLKIGEATRLLENSDLNISEIVAAIGLSNRSYFSKMFKKEYGVSPSYFRRRAGEGTG